MNLKNTLSFLVFFPLLVLGSAKNTQNITIGAVFPLTGPIATYGQESINGMNLALKKINEKGINGQQIKIIIEDNKGEPVESANAVRKLISVDKVRAILGSVASSNTLAAAPIAQEAGVPMLTPASTNQQVTKTGEFLARTCFTDSFQGEVMAKFASKSLGKKKAAVIVDLSSDYSKGLAAIFHAKFKDFGGRVIDKSFSYNQKDTDFRTLLRKVRRTKPDVIFLPGYYTEVGLILKQAREMGIKVPFLGGDGWHSDSLKQLAGPKGMENNYYSSHFSPNDANPMVQEFVKEYEQAYKTKPGAMAALSYDGLMVMAQALRNAKTIDGKDLKIAINQTKNFIGVTGLISLDENRNARKSAVVLKTTPTGNKFEERISP